MLRLGPKASPAHQETISSGKFDPYRTFIERVPFMIGLARETARQDSFSYRGFRVGSAIFAIDHELSGFAIFAAGNTKRSPAADKVCAEKKATIRAEKAGLEMAIGYVTVGTTDRTQIREVTGKDTPTLHPCAHCLELLAESPIVSDDTIIFTGGLDQDVAQAHKFGQLNALYEKEYDDDNEQAAGACAISGFANWDRRLLAYDLEVSMGRYSSASAGNAALAHHALSITIS